MSFMTHFNSFNTLSQKMSLPCLAITQTYMNWFGWQKCYRENKQLFSHLT